ncbi:hypothetical protein NFF84_04135 [Proteus mirabilis]|nr:MULTISPECIES: hypothetical protein [Morganellaceae]ELA7710279.1 hypothetical protein [Morganella morganii]EKT8675453.1 hypothetical protein [Proteus mirabilis]EKU9860448.1 hypothetical protein [Proteus mirabilis]EKW3345539.1 hypothetical protein [Proteus mirabilis]EKW4129400.1 hypothetical protein [Proteus mirabilis]
MEKQPVIIHADKRRKKEIQHCKKHTNSVLDLNLFYSPETKKTFSKTI